MLYSEYALELSNLDIYFKQKPQDTWFSIEFDSRLTLLFVWGLILGYLLRVATSRKSVPTGKKSQHKAGGKIKLR